MQKGRAACKVGILRRNVAPIGRLVCRLIFLYLVYSTPALAHDPGRESGPAEGNRMLSESLDPKHDRDHDEDRDGHDEYDDGGHGGGEHGHGHFRDWDPDHHGHDHDHDHDPAGGGSCPAAAIPTFSSVVAGDSVTGLAEAYVTKNAGTGLTLSVTNPPRRPISPRTM